MTTIRISERGREPAGRFRVRVSFDDDGEYDTEIAEPSDGAVEADLSWYFEQHLRYPFLDTDRERLAVRQITDYGQALFAQVFGGMANHDYRKLRDRSFDGCQLTVSGSAALHSLHWEALRDPEMDVPLGLRLPITHRVDALPSRFELPDPRPTLNILLVTARPHGSRDVGYRTISRPMLASLRIADLPVRVDMVRPGTWDALQAHLRRATEQNGSGWYQIAHFDLHGMFSEYAPLAGGINAEHLVFAHRRFPQFEGRRGFLFFETAQEGAAEPVPAEAVASLLAEHRVPIAVLNACQSAMQSADEAGLAQRLAEAGVPVAVGMAYSVTVSAAERAMPVLYGRIAEGMEPVSAVHAARRELFEHRGRRAYFDQQIDLEDWMLPVVFSQRRFQIRLRDMTDRERAQFHTREAITGNEPTPEYGFVGRDLDVLAIERRLLTSQDSNELLIQGMAGAGKSTLLGHLAWWWQQTGLVEQVFQFSYEDKAWDCGQIIREVRSRLFSPVEQAQADSMPEAAQMEQAARRLRAHRHLLILDNAESITGASAAIPHALSAAEQGKLKTFLSQLRGGRTLVLLGSREPEKWLTGGSAGPGIYPLPGLDPQATSMLVDRILRRHGAAKYLQDTAERTALDDLVATLGGYPLPLTTVLPVLSTTPPSAVLAELKTGGPEADPADLIHRAIEYSHGKLDPALQNSLLLLAPFSAVIHTGPGLALYRDLLLDHKAAKDLGPVDLAAALRQAVRVGLAVSHPYLTEVVQLQPVLPYFLRRRLRGMPSLREAADQAHYELYCQVSEELYAVLMEDWETGDIVDSQDLVAADYANLSEALGYGLSTGQPVIQFLLPLNRYLRLKGQHQLRHRILDDVIETRQDGATGELQGELAQVHNMAASAAIDERRLDHARNHFETALRLYQAAEDRRAQGDVFFGLGRVARQQRRFDEAQVNYRNALGIFVESGDETYAARIYYHLGWLAQDQLRLKDARANYRKALEIQLKSGDQRGASETYHQVGTLAQDERSFDEAAAYYQRALQIKLALGYPAEAAGTYHAMGFLYQKQERYAEAEASYRHALDIFLKFNIPYEAGRLFHQIGTLAQAQDRYDEAEANYLRAVEILSQFGDHLHLAGSYHNLGTLSGARRRFDEAEAYFHKALETYGPIGDHRGAGHSYSSLGKIAEEQLQFTEAEANLRKALENYREFGDRPSAERTAHRLALVLAELGQHAEAARQLIPTIVTVLSESGALPIEDLLLLQSERALIDPAEFATLARATVPPDLAEEFFKTLGYAGEIRDILSRESVLQEWLDHAPDWSASAAYLADHAQELFDPSAIGKLSSECSSYPGDLSRWLHLGLLHLADQAAQGYAAVETGDPDPYQETERFLEDSELDRALGWACVARAVSPGPGALLMAQIQIRRGALDAASQALAYAADAIEDDRLAEILATYEDLLATEPADPWIYAQYAIALVWTNQQSRAITAYDQAISIAQDDPSLRLNKARLLFSMSRFQEAQTELLAVITLCPDDVLGESVLLAAIAWPTDTEQAKEHLWAALSSYGRRLAPYTRVFYRAIALTGLGRNDEALAEIETARAHAEQEHWQLDSVDETLLERFREPPLPRLDILRGLLKPGGSKP